MLALGTLVSGIAHEINNPNHVITLSLPFLRSVWDDALPVLEEHARKHPDFKLANLPLAEVSQEVGDLFDELTQGTERINLIVSRLRDYSRTPLEEDKEAVDLNGCVDRALALLAAQVRKKSGNFSVDLEGGIPFVWASSRRLEQIVINLVLNASQALEGTRGALSVRTAHDAAPGRVVLTVEDEGCGISPDDMPYIVNPFFTTRRSEGATGLGLAVSSRIAEDLGGELSFRSEPGRGTTARLSLPALEE